VNGFVKVLAAVPVALVAAGAVASVFATAEPGLWEITRSGSKPVRLCVADIAELAQFDHRKPGCTRSVIRDNGSQATVTYSCSSGDFGQSDVTLVTPRALSIQMQGISASAPFKYTLQAHRIGDCPK
jgi:hypothetical protein